MPNEQFKRGQIVQLKSGGPQMTVTQVHDDPGPFAGYVECSWFGGRSKHESGRFHIETLRDYFADED